MRCQTVDVRRPHDRIAVASNLERTKLIGQANHHIGRAPVVRASCGKPCSAEGGLRYEVSSIHGMPVKGSRDFRPSPDRRDSCEFSRPMARLITIQTSVYPVAVCDCLVSSRVSAIAHRSGPWHLALTLAARFARFAPRPGPHGSGVSLAGRQRNFRAGRTARAGHADCRPLPEHDSTDLITLPASPAMGCRATDRESMLRLKLQR